jgi:hypothetical protein
MSGNLAIRGSYARQSVGIRPSAVWRRQLHRTRHVRFSGTGRGSGKGTAGPQEQHFTIRYGETGHSFETIVGPYLAGAKEVIIEEPYVRITHQVQNLVRFCEAVVKLSSPTPESSTFCMASATALG